MRFKKMLVLAPTMEFPPADQSIDRMFSRTSAVERSREQSDLENEVTALFDDLRGPLLRYLSSFGLSLHDAEEVTQEVFLSLFLHLRAGKPRSNIRAWIFRVAHNLGLKCREKNYRILKAGVHPDDRPMELLVDGALDPEQHINATQRRERLLAVVNALPERDRQCLYLRAEGFRYREIAQVLGISLGGVALALARSLGRLTSVDAR
jgi:RNA polymerase sigma-70 factor (ECF subfamily)